MSRARTEFSPEYYNCMNVRLICFNDYITVYIYFNKMKKEVGMLLQKRTDTSAVGIYKLYEENTH